MNLPKKLVCITVMAASLAQAQLSKVKPPAKEDFAPSKFELDLFSGAQLFHKRPDPLNTKLLNSMLFGTRLTENLWKYWSLEQSFSGSTLADLTLLPVPGAGGAQRVDLEQRMFKFGFNPVYHLTPLGSRFRPYLTIGFTEAIYHATDDGKKFAAALTPVAIPSFKSSYKPALNYGGGFKYRLTDLVGIRFDVRGLWSGAPDWGLPNSPAGLPAGALFIPNKGSMHGMEATAGIGFNFGGGAVKGPAVSKTKMIRTFELSPIQGSPASGFAGDMFTFRTNLTDSANAPGILYTWMVDGVAQPGLSGPELRTALPGGAHEIKVTATDPATRTMASAGPYSTTVGTVRTFELSPIQANPTSAYAGEPITFRTKLTDSANSPNVVYTWTVDGAAQPGATGAEYRTTNLSAGTHEIKVTATDPASGRTATTPGYSITVNPVPPLTITDSVDKTQLKVGETAKLTAQGSENAYSGPLTYTWKTNAGSTQGTGSNVTFVSSSMTFDPANVFKPETRTATVTPTVTDSRGRTANGNPLQITVTKDPQAMRLDDLVYGKGSTRVNNCAKRILIDELQALMNNNPDVDVLLIGHIDKAEPVKGPKGRLLHLDHQRVYNAAAVLTAGTGVCAKCDLSRIQVAYAGTSQSSDFRSGFCGTSTRQKSDERKTDAVAADDEAAKNRRVEIWIVPKGVAMPGGAKDVQAAPVKVIKAKGCPK